MKDKSGVKLKGWYKIFGYNQGQIDGMKGDLECGSEADLMQDLIDNYNPPTRKRATNKIKP